MLPLHCTKSTLPLNCNGTFAYRHSPATPQTRTTSLLLQPASHRYWAVMLLLLPLLLLLYPQPPCTPLTNRESASITHTKWRPDLRDKARGVRLSNFVYDAKNGGVTLTWQRGARVNWPYRNLNLLGLWKKNPETGNLFFQFTYFCSVVYGYTKGPVTLF